MRWALGAWCVLLLGTATMHFPATTAMMTRLPPGVDAAGTSDAAPRSNASGAGSSSSGSVPYATATGSTSVSVPAAVVDSAQSAGEPTMNGSSAAASGTNTSRATAAASSDDAFAGATTAAGPASTAPSFDNIRASFDAQDQGVGGVTIDGRGTVHTGNTVVATDETLPGTTPPPSLLPSASMSSSSSTSSTSSPISSSQHSPPTSHSPSPSLDSPPPQPSSPPPPTSATPITPSAAPTPLSWERATGGGGGPLNSTNSTISPGQQQDGGSGSGSGRGSDNIPPQQPPAAGVARRPQKKATRNPLTTLGVRTDTADTAAADATGKEATSAHDGSSGAAEESGSAASPAIGASHIAEDSTGPPGKVAKKRRKPNQGANVGLGASEAPSIPATPATAAAAAAAATATATTSGEADLSKKDGRRHGSTIGGVAEMTSSGNLMGRRSALFSVLALLGFVGFIYLRRWWRRRMRGSRLLSRLLPKGMPGMPGVKRRASGKTTDDEGGSLGGGRDDLESGGGSGASCVGGGLEMASMSMSARVYQPRMRGRPRGSSTILSESNMLDIAKVLPSGLGGSDFWTMRYTTSVHGYNLSKFYSLARGCGPTVMVVLDAKGSVFGAFAPHSWTRGPSYYGTGESFLMKIHPHFESFKWTRKNHQFMVSRSDFIALGGGGNFGLWMDAAFERGTSAPSPTYDNPCLAGSEHFKIVGLELWSVGE